MQFKLKMLHFKAGPEEALTRAANKIEGGYYDILPVGASMCACMHDVNCACIRPARALQRHAPTTTKSAGTA